MFALVRLLCERLPLWSWYFFWCCANRGCGTDEAKCNVEVRGRTRAVVKASGGARDRTAETPFKTRPRSVRCSYASRDGFQKFAWICRQKWKPFVTSITHWRTSTLMTCDG